MWKAISISLFDTGQPVSMGFCLFILSKLACLKPFSRTLLSKQQPDGLEEPHEPAYRHHSHRYNPTKGYEVDIYAVCKSTDPLGAVVDWVLWVPGPFCTYDKVATWPWRVVTFPLSDLAYTDKGIEEIWWCSK